MHRQLLQQDLSVIAAFKPFSPQLLSALRDNAQVYCLKPQEILLYQGDVIHSFYAVLEGGVRLVEQDEKGTSVTLKIYGPGDIFGLLAVSGHYTHPAQIEAIHHSMVIAINGQSTRQLVLEYPELGLAIIDLLTGHVHHAHQRIRYMTAERVDRRLARTLLHYSDKFGKQQCGKISIDVPLSQRDLAEFAGTTVETINRTLTQWSKQGIVASAHKHIDILDREALVAIAEDRQSVTLN